MIETHTPYQRGRRAAERGAPRECPVGMFDVDGVFEWLKGFDSVPLLASVDHPAHYNTHPSGIECIQVVEHMSFNLGNAVKYIWRADEKGNALEDLKKAEWYIKREITRRESA